MKTKLSLLIALCPVWTFAQQFTEKINKEYTFEKTGPANTLIVANLNGAITVTGYDGDKVIVEVERTIIAKTDSRLEKGKQEVQLGVIDRADTLILYVNDGCNKFARRPDKHNRWNASGWGFNWSENDRNCNLSYDYTMHFTIRVPAAVNVMVSTINEGDVSVSDVKGKINANNINGGIRLSRVTRESVAATINGDVDVEYIANPEKDCRFYTLNGHINAVFPRTLAASMGFESFNGEFYTDIESIEPMPISVVKADEGDGTKYKVSGNRYRIGKGGPAYLDFETFNGDVYLKTK